MDCVTLDMYRYSLAGPSLLRPIAWTVGTALADLGCYIHTCGDSQERLFTQTLQQCFLILGAQRGSSFSMKTWVAAMPSMMPWRRWARMWLPSVFSCQHAQWRHCGSGVKTSQASADTGKYNHPSTSSCWGSKSSSSFISNGSTLLQNSRVIRTSWTIFEFNFWNNLDRWVQWRRPIWLTIAHCAEWFGDPKLASFGTDLACYEGKRCNQLQRGPGRCYQLMVSEWEGSVHCPAATLKCAQL